MTAAATRSGGYAFVVGLIWAQTPAGVIGKGGALPWRVPEDLAHFRAVTNGFPVVMGRATWLSLPERSRPLPGRPNVVLSRDAGFVADGAGVVPSIGSALGGLDGVDEQVWVIGGAAVYAAALTLADRLEVTQVDVEADGDAFAPRVDPADWVTVTGPWLTSRTGVRYRFLSSSRR